MFPWKGLGLATGVIRRLKIGDRKDSKGGLWVPAYRLLMTFDFRLLAFDFPIVTFAVSAHGLDNEAS